MERQQKLIHKKNSEKQKEALMPTTSGGLTPRAIHREF